MFHRVLLACAALFRLAPAGLAAGGGAASAMPDFTRGGTIPAGAVHDWNLGPTGARGWMFFDRMVTTDARQIAITAVEKGSPAEGALAVGDALLGAGGRPFTQDPRTELGRAITAAETEAGGGRLALTRWRAGGAQEVVVTLPVLGTYSATAPYACPKSQRILERGLRALAERAAQPDYAKRLNPIPRALNALALLAGGRPEHLPLVKREAEWAAAFEPGSFKTWYYGYQMILVAEYISAAGDASVLPGLRRLALSAARGQSAVGSWGHNFANPEGRLNGYGMMNAPGLPLTLGLVLARDAGVNEPEVARAIERSARLIRFYIGKGAVPYGDHPAWTQTHEDNGKSGMAALLFNRLGEADGAAFFARMATASHGNERDGGHTGNFFNMAWSLPAIALNGPRATGAWMEEFGGWYHDLARRHDGGFAHQGPPEAKNDSYAGWDATGPHLIALALPLKKIALTGKKPSLAPQLDDAAARRLIADGRGWTNKDRTSAYAALSDAELLDRLGSWSPTVRERAAFALAKRKEPPVAAIVALLDAPRPEARLGACFALAELRGAAAPAVPRLRALLQAPDSWLRVQAAEALAAIGAPALPALPDLLERLAAGPSPGDPRGMEQRYLTTAVFRGMLGNAKALAGVDRDRLRLAIARGLENQDGHARSQIGEIYRKLTLEELRPLLPDIHKAIVEPAPSGEMFADGVRLAGLELFATHHVEEGMQAAADYLRKQNPWGSQERVPKVLQSLLKYGAHAQSVLPSLRETAAIFEAGEKDFPGKLSRQKAAAVREAIAQIESAQDRPALMRMR